MTTPRIAVIGDIMIDVEHHCTVNRLAPEGPFPVFKVHHTKRRLGGAGNVAAMLSTLGADVLLCGQARRSDVIALSAVYGLNISWAGEEANETTRKERFVVDGRYAGVRIDHDVPVYRANAYQLAAQIRQYSVSAVIVSDHGKGTITLELMQLLAQLDRIPVYVDSVRSTPMVDGMILVCGEHETPTAQHKPRGGIMKYGPGGLTHWMTGECSVAGAMPSVCKSVVDPLGAGDQLIAMLAYQRAIGVGWPDAVEIANRAAGLQCERMGCVPVKLEDLS